MLSVVCFIHLWGRKKIEQEMERKRVQNFCFRLVGSSNIIHDEKERGKKTWERVSARNQAVHRSQNAIDIMNGTLAQVQKALSKINTPTITQTFVLNSLE